MLFFILGTIIGIILTLISIISGILLSKAEKIRQAINYITKEEGLLIEKSTEEQEYIDKLLENDKDIKLEDYEQ